MEPAMSQNTLREFLFADESLVQRASHATETTDDSPLTLFSPDPLHRQEAQCESMH